MSLPPPVVRVEDEASVRRLVIDRPHRANALTVALLDELAGAVAAAAGDGVRVLVLTGAGTRFSAGFDLAELSGTVADVAVDDAIGRAGAAIQAAPVPVIAAVNGACAGAAVELARACDVVVADPAATFAIPATRLGLLYRPAALARLHRRLGGAAARYVALTSETLDAATAARLGLVDRVADEPLATVVGALAGRLAALVPEAVAATKAMFNALDDGATDLEPFEPIRRELLDTPARRAAISAHQQRLTSKEER